ncbi:hypothetical protein AA313_de0203184 [Arthrobotrys entomopaga]|nr:hypothetical protein AA313_de0203184 [Arthrobotrys entomopaga]
MSASSVDSIVTVLKLTPEQEIETPAQILAKKKIAEFDERAAAVKAEFEKNRKLWEMEKDKKRQVKEKRKVEKERIKEVEKREIEELLGRTPSPPEKEEKSELPYSTSVSLIRPSQQHRRRIVPGTKNSAIQKTKEHETKKPPARYLPGPGQITRPTDPPSTVYGPPQVPKIEPNYGKKRATCPAGRLPKSVVTSTKSIMMQFCPMAWTLLETYISQGNQDQEAKDSLDESITHILRRLIEGDDIFSLKQITPELLLVRTEEFITKLYEEPEEEPEEESE